jgi:hypothetical protein
MPLSGVKSQTGQLRSTGSPTEARKVASPSVAVIAPDPSTSHTQSSQDDIPMAAFSTASASVAVTAFAPTPADLETTKATGSPQSPPDISVVVVVVAVVLVVTVVLVVVVESSGARSTAPQSQAAPCGLATPR